MSCGVGYRRSLDPALLWLWCMLAGPLAWELPYATGMVLKTNNNKKTPQSLRMRFILRAYYNIPSKSKETNLSHKICNLIHLLLSIDEKIPE